ncbi:hypothetical protein ACWGQ4_06375, partial [Streptomyces sp. NPDC055721]
MTWWSPVNNRERYGHSRRPPPGLPSRHDRIRPVRRRPAPGPRRPPVNARRTIGAVLGTGVLL